MKWLTYAELQRKAKLAKKHGFLLRLEPTKDGWEWDWLHKASGMIFSGDCNTPIKAVAFSCAIQGLPVVA